jgi:hypothetical protein
MPQTSMLCLNPTITTFPRYINQQEINHVSRPRLILSLNWEVQGNGSYFACDEATGLSARIMKSGIKQ